MARFGRWSASSGLPSSLMSMLQRLGAPAKFDTDLVGFVGVFEGVGQAFLHDAVHRGLRPSVAVAAGCRW